MEFTPNPELERLRAEKEKNEREVEQLTHKITRLENRQKYFENGERKRHTHRLCTIAGTLESIVPKIKELDITEVMELLEHIFHKEEIQNQEDQAENIDRFIRQAKKYLYLEKLTPTILNDMVNAVYVHAPDKSSGYRVQDVTISYNYIGILPANLLYDVMNGKAA